jgi:hypothetical protein
MKDRPGGASEEAEQPQQLARRLSRSDASRDVQTNLSLRISLSPMIARFLILLPFNVPITDEELWPAFDGTWTGTDGSMPDYQFRFQAPALYAERPRSTDSVHAHVVSWATKFTYPAFSESLLLNGRKIGEANVLCLDFKRSDFDRSLESNRSFKPSDGDPPPQLAFEVANAILARIRVNSRAFYIQPLLLRRDPWRLTYLTDSLQELDQEVGKVRGRITSSVNVGVVALTPETMQSVADRWTTNEPYVWDELLLDAHALWPNVGATIVMAYAALETFIEWSLEILQEEHQKLSAELWKWIKKRDHWAKEPSVAEQFDALLLAFTGQSLKREEKLWIEFNDLKKARNSLVHEGVPQVAGKRVDGEKAKQLLDSADKIVAWVELLLPEKHRRGRATAADLYHRRLATPEESASLGPARVVEGPSGTLEPGGPGVVFEFQTTSAGAGGGPNIDDDANRGTLPSQGVAPDAGGKPTV